MSNYNPWGGQQQQQLPNNPQQAFNAQAFPALGGDQQQQQQLYYQQMMAQQQQQQQFGGYASQPQFVAPVQNQWAIPTPVAVNPWAIPQPTGTAAPVASSWNMASLQGALPAGGSSSFTPSSAAGGSVFIPKKKQAAAGGGEFPSLGAAGATVAAKEAPKKEPEDPCYGKPKEFFIYDFNQQTNTCFCTAEQLSFVAANYTDHYFAPIDILMWLYDIAEYNEAVKLQATAKPAKVAAKPATGGSKALKKQESSEEEYEEEESTFGNNYKNQKKGGKAAAAPTKPVFASKQLTEAQKEEQRKKKLQQMQQAQRQKEIADAKKIKPVDVAQTEDMVEVDETRKPASLVFIGHVDAGKSTICGNLMLGMGVVDQRTVQKFKEEAKEKNRESWWLAYAMDESEQERAKGKTVEMGRANFDTEKKRMTIFDAPGHKNYVPNMIMGAALADYGALVISAKKGEYEAGFDADGQTREHVQLAKSLGIYKLIVVVNKMDEPSVKWSVDRYNEIVAGLRPFLMQSGYHPDTDCTFVPVSGLNGENIMKQAPAGTCNWYKDGRTLIQILDELPLPPRDENAPLRIPVLDKMTDRGVVIFGKIESGTVKIGDGIRIMPSGQACLVTTVWNSKDQCVKYAKPGENIKLRISIDSEDKVNKGDLICLRDEPAAPVSELFEAEVDILELISYKPILSKGYQCILHIHTVADEATVKEIITSYEKNERGDVLEKSKPQFAKSHSKIICRIQTRIPIPLEKHDYMPQLGRFTLRDEGKTIAVGKVLRYKPAKEILVGAPVVAGKEEAKKGATTATAQVKETFFDMDTGEEISKEEHLKRKAERDKAELAGIAESDEDEEDDAKKAAK